MIDYDLMRREYPKVKGALTRARNSGDPLKVRAAVAQFVKLSDDCGAMPDDWHRWRNAFVDAYRDWYLAEDRAEDFDGQLDEWRAIGARLDF